MEELKKNAHKKFMHFEKLDKKNTKMRLPIPGHLATEETKIDWSRPVDFSFNGLTKFEKLEPETANTDRLGRVDRGNENKYLSKSLWMNNNSLQDTKNIEDTITSLMQYPEKLSFLDLSFNEIKEINEDLLKFPNLNILYFHGNNLNDIKDVLKLRKLKYLHILTLYGNPFYKDKSLGNIRSVIAQLLPQLKKLDFNGISKKERETPVSKKIVDLTEKVTKGFQPVIIDETKVRRKEVETKKHSDGPHKILRSEINKKKIIDGKNEDLKNIPKHGEKNKDISNKKDDIKIYQPILVSKCFCK